MNNQGNQKPGRCTDTDSKLPTESGDHENLKKLLDEINAIRFDSEENALRAKKILRIKKEILAGEYNPNTRDVAQALIEELYSS